MKEPCRLSVYQQDYPIISVFCINFVNNYAGFELISLRHENTLLKKHKL